MLFLLYRRHADDRVAVIRRTTVHGVDFISFSVQHLAKITIFSCFWEEVVCPRRIHIIDVAQGYNLRVGLLAYTSQLAMSDATNADATNLYYPTRRDMTCPSQNVAGGNSQSRKCAPGSIHKITT
jgi:hypothetical protein